ncbi:acetyl-CoA synthetase [Aspergillus tubingensis]|uniref:acetate--CoA ligase n=1 Tax=Aspergillus tubingensis TaxID=5068 RepID=A0A9W6AWH3_ASPTU|nr:acetyl-CoA synthetase [Aspergillus tubingensis]
MASDVMTVAFEWRERHPSQPHLGNMLQYHDLYKQSIESPSQFWSNQARELLWFTQDFHTPHIGSFEDGYNAWFLGGQLNASFNCIDRHMIDDPDRVAIIYEPDDPNQVVKRVTYGELLGHVSKLAGFLRSQGVKKGDIVTIYMSMVPEVIYSLLACARIGAVHSVVFAGFSAAALRDRIVDANSKVVITADEGRRGGKSIPTKHIVDEALKNCPCVSTVLIYERTGSQVPCVTGRDFWWNEEVKKFPTYISPEPMDSEDYLFMLYTSGSTGKPKGVLHSTAGYLLGAAVTGKYVFDVHKDDIFFCAGDIGWITGHTYVAYAPLLLGCTTVMFEGTPAYPSYTRYWEIIAKHAVTHFYAAPTALRLLKRSVSKEDVAGFDTSSLRVLGSVGEPIAPEVWKWYSDFMGNAKAYITDFTGDGAFRDFDGHLWIRGRIDDVINVSGHRLSTSEIESAAIEHGAVAEIAVIGVADDLTGQAINAFVSLKTLDKPPEIENDLVLQIRRLIGPFAVPKKVIIVRELPKTRSGKNVRRILRKIASGDTDFGDTSTLADPGIVNDVIQAFSRGVKRAPRP